MRRYWVDASSIQETSIDLTGEVFHHICVVCRQKLNSRFEVLSGGKAFFVEIVEIDKKTATAKILEKRRVPTIKPPPLHLALSLPKYSTVEKVLEKSVELGVDTLHLFSSDFSFAKPRSKELEKKLQRWQKIIQGATQQTGRGELMKLTQIEPLSVILKSYASRDGAIGVLAFEGAGDLSLDSVLNATKSCKEVWLFIGGEGGFSLADIELFKDYDLLPMSLGDQVLRVETACVTLLSILKYGLGHFTVK